jgi:hypothetical protein
MLSSLIEIAEVEKRKAEVCEEDERVIKWKSSHYFDDPTR